MKNLRYLALAPFVAGATLIAAPAEEVFARGGVEVGILVCDTVPGTKRNVLIHSTVDVSCVFKAANGTRERYRGETGIGFGLDLKLESDETMAFAVLSGTSDVDAMTLTGRYVGAKASAEVGVGVGAAVLVGGGDQNVTLQPLAVEGSKGGAGATAGIGYLRIEPDDS